jgi:hypothetical protein
MQIVQEPSRPQLERQLDCDAGGGAVVAPPVAAEVELITAQAAAAEIPLARWRRTIARLRRDPGLDSAEQPMDALTECKLELILLREENARLKSALHRPPNVGALVDELRLLAGAQAEVDNADAAWDALTSSYVLHEALLQGISEVDAAINALRMRLPHVPEDVASRLSLERAALASAVGAA